MAIYGVLLGLVFDDVFDYSYDGELKIGQLVLVPFGREEHVGVVYKIGKSANIDDKKIKKIKQIINLPLILPSMLTFIEKVSQINDHLKIKIGEYSACFQLVIL